VGASDWFRQVWGADLQHFRLGWPIFMVRTCGARRWRAVGGHLRARHRGDLWCCRCWLSRAAWRVWWSRSARLGAIGQRASARRGGGTSSRSSWLIPLPVGW